jgi:hypothetical protein
MRSRFLKQHQEDVSDSFLLIVHTLCLLTPTFLAILA